MMGADDASLGEIRRPDVVVGERRSRIAALDGIRGLAILMVILYRFHFDYFSTDWPDLSNATVRYTATLLTTLEKGVDLFFVLSGFLITRILLRASPSVPGLRNFYMRRVLRIAPLYFAMLTIVLVVIPAFFVSARRHVADIAEHQNWLWLFASNIYTAFRGWHFSFLNHFWTLAIEEQFYLFWPIVVLGVRRRRAILLCLGILAISCVLRMSLVGSGHLEAAHVFPLCRFDTFAVGSLLALLTETPSSLHKLLPWLRWIGGLVAVLLALIFIFEKRMLSFPITLYAILFGTMIGCAISTPHGSRLERFWTGATLRFLGKYSYGIYVVHLPIAYLLAQLVPIASCVGSLNSQLFGRLVHYLIVIGVTLVLAIISWHVLESPVLRLRRLYPLEPDKT